MKLSRRQFFRICAGGMAGTAVASLGFLPSFSAHAETRQYKLLKAKETRNNCTYCSVGCGILMYSFGDNAKNVRERIYHVEGDPDHPVSRGSRCAQKAQAYWTIFTAITVYAIRSTARRARTSGRV